MLPGRTTTGTSQRRFRLLYSAVNTDPRLPIPLGREALRWIWTTFAKNASIEPDSTVRFLCEPCFRIHRLGLQGRPRAIVRTARSWTDSPTVVSLSA